MTSAPRRTLAAPFAIALASFASAALLTACGGGGGTDGGTTGTSTSSGDTTGADPGTEATISSADAAPDASGISIQQRRDAAKSTAMNNAACKAVQPFYWSVGDASGVRGDGRTNLVTSPTATTALNIASASKMIYGAYVTTLRNGALTSDDVNFLHFTSGYTVFDNCLRDQTVAQCQSYQGPGIDNGGYVKAFDGKFYYSGGHMQKHATDFTALGPDANDALAAAIDAMLGGTSFAYTEPQLAGGAKASASQYGAFLRRVVNGGLPAFNAALGTNAVCTNPSTCADAVYTPMPQDESPHYSMGHWVEDDAVTGDGAYSSAGAFGFYPWIAKKKDWWGVLARESMDGVDSSDPHQGPGVKSLYCGRQIRAAWVSGKAR